MCCLPSPGKRCIGSSSGRAKQLNAVNKRLRRSKAKLDSDGITDEAKKSLEAKIQKDEQEKEQLLTHPETAKKSATTKTASQIKAEKEIADRKNTPAAVAPFPYVGDVTEKALAHVYGEGDHKAVAKRVSAAINNDPIKGVDEAEKIIAEAYGADINAGNVSHVLSDLVGGDYTEDGDLESAIAGLPKVQADKPKVEKKAPAPKKEKASESKSASPEPVWNSKGFNPKTGLHRSGTEFDPETGLDIDGYDYNEFDANGIHKETGTKYNEDGINRLGYDASGEKDENFFIPSFERVEIEDIDFDEDLDLDEDDFR